MNSKPAKTGATQGDDAPFVRLTDENIDAFASIRLIIATFGGRALDKLYDCIAADPRSAKILFSPEQRARASKAQFQHWMELFTGDFDENAIRRSEHIGRVHANVGLSPKFYIGGYAQMAEELICGALDRGLHRRLSGRQLGRMIGTMVKVLMLDMDSALNAYFRVEEEARAGVIAALGDVLAKMADGDLSAQLDELPAKYAQVASDFQNMRSRMNTTVGQLSESAESIDTGAREITSAANDLARRTEQQANAVARTAEVTRAVATGIDTTARSAKEADARISEVEAQAKQGDAVVKGAVAAMDKILASSDEIAKISGVIEGIAFQTNLLALNAGVEAARAGDSGKGFAVVANEVRALAQRASDSAKLIQDLIGKAGQDVRVGVDLVGQTGVAFEAISAKISEAADLARHIATYADREATNLKELSVDIQQIDTNTQQNAAMVEQSNAAALSLSDQAGQLQQIVGQFKLERSEVLDDADRRFIEEGPIALRRAGGHR